MGITGNVSILKKHLNDQGLDVSLEQKSFEDEINIEDYDFIYLGSGTERSLDAVLEDIKKYKDNNNCNRQY